MTRSNTAILIFLTVLFAFSGVAQSADTVEELKACARVTDQDARHACYDKLGERVLREEPAARKPADETAGPPTAVTATATSAQSLPDELGKPQDVEYVGTITSCRQGGRGDWYFFFDNGQVWKDVNKRTRRFKDCNFNATITRDGFGYKMQIDGSERTIRVKRHK